MSLPALFAAPGVPTLDSNAYACPLLDVQVDCLLLGGGACGSSPN
jgi:hypothetical protein